MTSIVQDLTLARRLLTKSPLFTTIVVTTLALAIGLNTAVFSAVDAQLLRPMPGLHRPDQIVQLYRSAPGGIQFNSNSIPHWQDLRDRTGDVLSNVAIWTFNPYNISARGEPRLVMGAIASANYFATVGVVPLKGRFFVPQEDTGRLAHRVAVLSYIGWQKLFGGDVGIVDKDITLNGQQYRIVGITPENFTGTMPMVTPLIWVPLTQLGEAQPGSERQWERRSNNSYNVIARMKEGVTVAAVNERMTRLLGELRAVYPDEYRESGITVVRQSDAGIHPMFRSAQMGLSLVVMAVVAILLLIACVNVANLFLARGRDRAREMAVRLSLGAARGALVRQLLVESLVFSTISAMLGLGIAQWAISITNQVSLPFDIEFSAGLELSPMVLGFTVLVTIVAAVLFGIAPALQATRPSLVPALKGEEPAGESRSRVRNGLVVAQMALSIILLTCAGLFLRNLRAATTFDKGFNSENVLVATMDPGMQGYSRARAEQFYAQLRARLQAQSAVRQVGFTQILPLSLNESDTDAMPTGYTRGPNENMSVQYSIVTDGYFDAMGIKILSGRDFRTSDDSAAQRVLIVNQQFVQKYFAGGEALGKTVRTRGSDHTIIGVVPTGKYQRLGEPATPFMYFAQNQRYNAGQTIVIRTSTDPESFIPTLRAEVAALDRSLPIANVQSMNRQLGIALMPARITGAALGVFGVLGLILAAIGMYGVMAYSVAQRTREIGIRMAIGAAASDVIRLVMRQGMTLVVIGGVIGLVGAVGASRLLGGILYGGGENDLLTFVAVPVVLVCVAVLATWVPARRAANTDPLAALRQE
jgi:predicted permease